MSLWFEPSRLCPQPREAAERRITTKLMDYWIVLCQDEPYARMGRFNIEAIPGLARHAFVLDLQHGQDDPRVSFIGDMLSADCGADVSCRRLSDVPQASLLARVAGHYREVLDNQGPAEFADDHADGTKQMMLYRGIMLPFTTDGKSIDFVIGAVTSKVTGPASLPGALNGSAEPQDPNQGARRLLAMVEAEVAGQDRSAESPKALNRSLRECQALVHEIVVAESRSHKALYAALERVYAFHFQAEADPAAFEQLLAGAGLRIQSRALFTPLVKLVFGTDYDKTRLSEYAAALSYAKRRGTSAASFRNLLEVETGGLKSCVKAERLARRAARRRSPDKTEQAKDDLRRIETLGLIGDLEGGADEFVLVLGRRTAGPGGVIEVLRILDEKPAVVDPVIRRAARAVKRERPRPKGARKTGAKGPREHS